MAIFNSKRLVYQRLCCYVGWGCWGEGLQVTALRPPPAPRSALRRQICCKQRRWRRAAILVQRRRMARERVARGMVRWGKKPTPQFISILRAKMFFFLLFYLLSSIFFLLFMIYYITIKWYYYCYIFVLLVLFRDLCDPSYGWPGGFLKTVTPQKYPKVLLLSCWCVPNGENDARTWVAQSAGAARCVGSHDDLNYENPADVHWFDKDDTDDKVIFFLKHIFFE